ncbi:Putative disease resistance RPP13-like protein 1 [Linum perenne]
MEVVASIGGAILSASFQALLDQLGSPDLLSYYGISRRKVLLQFNNWERMLKKIHAVLDDAEYKQLSNRLVKIWVGELRDLAYDLDDVLDEFSTEVGRHKMRTLQPSSSSTTTKTTCKFMGIDTMYLRGAKLNAKLVSEMERITGMLQEITVQKDELDLREISGERKRLWERAPTTCLVNHVKVYGREEDQETLIDMLISKELNGSEVCVIPVLGMGGIGKTTLAQLVFNDARLEFDVRIWVSVGEDFDVFKITKQMLQLNNCDGGVPGSRIMVTTRNQSVSDMIATVPAYCIRELAYDDCVSVFAQHALGERSFHSHPKLLETGRKIVKKCGGLPLAAKALGGLLRGKPNLNAWQEVLNSNIWNLPEEKNGILPALWLSYHHLPPQLKRCFAYCAVFPKDYELSQQELVLLWMAEGFLHQPDGLKHTQELGCQYFDELLSRSFFQESTSSKSKYVMHDLICDLAYSVSGEICFHLDDPRLSSTKSYAKVRHSSFTRHVCDISQKFEVLYQMNNLRTFLSLPILPARYHQLTSRVLHDLVPKLKRLRVLSLAGYGLVNLPESIGTLKHLRYLNLAYTEISSLPQSVSELINLQTLILYRCWKLVALPADICNLVNLEYLDITDTDSLQEMPHKIGNLEKLYMLPKFIVGVGSGCGIIELAKTSRLQGKLCIQGLQNVVNARGAEIANLKEKPLLDELVLEWTDDLHCQRDENLELLVIDSLQPHHSLQKLTVKFYAGLKFPLWMTDRTFNSIVELQILNCRKIKSLPPLGQLASLKKLSIKGADGVREVGSELCGVIAASGIAFPSLRILNIENMLEWEHWSWLDGLPEEDARRFPYLVQLSIINCPKLVGKLPEYLPSLWKLKVCQCPLLNNLPQVLPSLNELIVEDCQAILLESAPDLNYLSLFRISRITGLVSLQELIQKMMALDVLEIKSCAEMMYLSQDKSGFDKLGKLKYMKIKNCKSLISLVEGEEGLLPCNVEVLRLEQCQNLTKLPNGLSRLTNLRDLNIDGCSNLKAFPGTGLPSSIKSLWIRDCQLLESVPEGVFHDGNDSKKMPHLKTLYIGNCPSLQASPTGELPVSLKTISSSYFTQRSLDSLDSQFGNLMYMEIADCPWLQKFPEGGLSSIPSLTYLTISGCVNLSSLPDRMQNLLSLQHFEIHNCGSVVSFPEGGLPPNLTTLMIRNCKKLSQPISSWGLHRLTSLKRIKLEGTCPSTDTVCFPDEEGLLLPSSLTLLWIHSLDNLKCISRGVKNLRALENLWIWNCPKLKSLPMRGLPDTLGFLEINACPLLKKRFQKKEKHFRRSSIAQIPCIVVDSTRLGMPLNPVFMSQYLVHTWGLA